MSDPKNKLPCGSCGINGGHIVGCAQAYLDHVDSDSKTTIWANISGAEEALDHRPNKPHYQSRGGIEPLDFIRSNKMRWEEGNAVKYIYRYPFSETPAEDLRDAIVYLQFLLDELEGKL